MRRLPISLTNVMLIVGAIIFIIYLYFADVNEIAATILSLDLKIALTAIFIDLTCIGLFVLGWYVLLKNPGMSYKDCFEIVLVSIFGDLMIPTASISGEFFRVSLAVKRGKIQVSEATASVLLHRILLALTFGVVLLISVFNLAGHQVAPVAEIYALGAVAILDLVLGITAMYMALRANLFERNVEKLVLKIGGLLRRFRPNYDPDRLRVSVLEGFRTFVQAIKSVKTSTFVISFLVLTARWFLIAMIPYIMFISLGRPVSYWVVLGVAVFVSMVQMIPIGIPGMVGVMEVSMTAFFMGFGIPPALAASATILTRLVIFWFELVISAFAASLQGVRGLRMSYKMRNNSGNSVQSQNSEIV
ncbi:MAG: lysylphosphatidylglycerol synthase transmembrane domain-containing protein [Candidatus Methanomethylicaceae archaeon]|nr:lysylphosphatidylglycerol synthase transmembrane domain-containing protein [Candidatus Verstraetearchaeota archaeon]